MGEQARLQCQLERSASLKVEPSGVVVPVVLDRRMRVLRRRLAEPHPQSPDGLINHGTERTAPPVALKLRVQIRDIAEEPRDDGEVPL